jgi:hypothetical protein
MGVIQTEYARGCLQLVTDVVEKVGVFGWNAPFGT